MIATCLSFSQVSLRVMYKYHWIWMVQLSSRSVFHSIKSKMVKIIFVLLAVVVCYSAAAPSTEEGNFDFKSLLNLPNNCFFDENLIHFFHNFHLFQWQSWKIVNIRTTRHHLSQSITLFYKKLSIKTANSNFSLESIQLNSI